MQTDMSKEKNNSLIEAELESMTQIWTNKVIPEV